MSKLTSQVLREWMDKIAESSAGGAVEYKLYFNPKDISAAELANAFVHDSYVESICDFTSCVMTPTDADIRFTVNEPKHDNIASLQNILAEVNDDAGDEGIHPEALPNMVNVGRVDGRGD